MKEMDLKESSREPYIVWYILGSGYADDINFTRFKHHYCCMPCLGPCIRSMFLLTGLSE